MWLVSKLLILLDNLEQSDEKESSISLPTPPALNSMRSGRRLYVLLQYLLCKKVIGISGMQSSTPLGRK